MNICKKKAIVIYGASTEGITSVLNSGKFQGCNIVGVCTDELVLGDSVICEIPVIQMDEINLHDNPIVLLLDDNFPGAFKKVALDKGIPMYNYKDVSLVDDELLDDIYNGEEDFTVIDITGSAIFNDNNADSIVEIENNVYATNDVSSPCDIQNSDAVEKSENGYTCFSDEQAEVICSSLATWFEKIYQAINNTKNKDTSIYNINKELQKFKDGYYGKLTSPIISEMITLREDFKKSIEDCSKFGLTYEKLSSYLECTVDQIDEILATYDVVVDSEKYSYNGKTIYPLCEEQNNAPCVENEYAEIAKEAYVFADSPSEIIDYPSLEKFLVSVTENVEKLLQNNEVLIKSIEIQNSDLKKQMAVTDGLLIVPLLRKIIRMKLAFLNKREMLANFKEEAETIYKEAYEYGIAYAESILMSLGVSVRSNIDDIYDPKYHRILKMQKILPEEAEKDKRIATFVTDCYISDERVVAPAKVIVFKL